MTTPYMHSLAQFHNLKALATKTMVEHQLLAKSLLQASLQNNNNLACKYFIIIIIK